MERSMLTRQRALLALIVAVLVSLHRNRPDSIERIVAVVGPWIRTLRRRAAELSNGREAALSLAFARNALLHVRALLEPPRLKLVGAYQDCRSESEESEPEAAPVATPPVPIRPPPRRPITQTSESGCQDAPAARASKPLGPVEVTETNTAAFGHGVITSGKTSPDQQAGAALLRTKQQLGITGRHMGSDIQ